MEGLDVLLAQGVLDAMLRLDLSRVSFIDSYAIRALVTRSEDTNFVISKVSPQVRSILELGGIDHPLPIAE